MFEFGRELRRIFKNEGRAEIDLSLFELMSLELLVLQGRSLDIDAGRISTKDRITPYLQSASIWRDYARRTGDIMAVRKSSVAAQNAGKEAKSAQDAVRSALDQAQTLVLSYDLFETMELLENAEALLGQCLSLTDPSDSIQLQLLQLEAQIAGRKAYRQAFDLDDAMKAMARIDRWVKACDERVLMNKGTCDKLRACWARLERAERLMAIARVRSDSAIFRAVSKEMEALKLRMDPASEPITCARIVLCLSQSLREEGILVGDGHLIAKSVSLLTPKDELIHYEHAPLIWAQFRLELAKSLKGLANLSQDKRIVEKAVDLLDLCLQKNMSSGLVLKAKLLQEHTNCAVDRALLAGSVSAIEDAIMDLKTRLSSMKPSLDPMSWAISQTQLVRLYRLRSHKRGEALDVSEAIYAIDSAIEIFKDHNCDELLSLAQELLSQLKQV